MVVSGGSGRGETPEAELVRAVQDGDERAFGRLVEAYLDEAHAVATSILRNRHDAEDAVQEAFIRALERIDHLSEGSPFGPWFYRVLRSTCLNLLRHEKRRDHDPIPHDASGGSDPASETARKMRQERVLEALSRLPEMQRTAVALYDLEGYSHREIAEILDVAEGTSRAHVHHGRKALRELLEERGEDERDQRERS